MFQIPAAGGEHECSFETKPWNFETHMNGHDQTRDRALTPLHVRSEVSTDLQWTWVRNNGRTFDSGAKSKGKITRNSDEALGSNTAHVCW